MTNDVYVYAGERSRRENREVPHIVRDLSKDSGKRQVKLCYVAGQHHFYCRTQQQQQALLPNRKRKKIKLYNIIY